MKVLLVVEDDPDIRLLLRFEFDRDPDLQIQGEAAEAESAIALARSIQPALVVLDHRLAGEMTGLEAAPRIKALVPGARIVLFSASEELRVPSRAEPAIDAFLMKTEIARLLPLCRHLLGLS